MRIPLSVEAIAIGPCNGFIPPKRRLLPPWRSPNGAGQDTGHRGGGADQRWPAGGPGRPQCAAAARPNLHLRPPQPTPDTTATPGQLPALVVPAGAELTSRQRQPPGR